MNNVRRVAVIGLGCAALAQVATPTATAAAGDPTRNIVIADDNFVPADIGVHPGTTVIWTNTDEVTHDITSTDAPVKFGTGKYPLHENQSFRFTFTKRGVYHFASTLHGELTGSVTVGDRIFSQAPRDPDRPTKGGELGPALPPKFRG
jgi:plastocyanin